MASELSLTAHLDQLVAVLSDALGTGCEVEAHDGLLSQDDLRRYLASESPVCAVAIVGLENIQLANRDQLSAQAEVVASIISRSADGEAYRSALDLAARVVWVITQSASWRDARLFRTPLPNTVRAETLFSGALDENEGITVWGVTWSQTCYLTRN